MSHIHVRTMIESQTKYAGRDWYYDFRSIPDICDETGVEANCQQLLTASAKITKDWSDEKNSEWISRVYFAAKMILSSSVMAQSLEFASSTNLRVVTSYLDYYTVLNSLRAVLLTNPHVDWKDGGLLETTHTKTINVATNILDRFDRATATNAKKHITHLKAFRELISYRAPSSGDSFPKAEVDVIALCRFCAEVAQMQSELFEVSVLKNVDGNFELSTDAIERICRNEIDGHEFFDSEDSYRMGYLRRKYPIPTNIRFVMSEGHVEDFFGSWCGEDESQNQFSPDTNWGILFDVP